MKSSAMEVTGYVSRINILRKHENQILTDRLHNVQAKVNAQPSLPGVHNIVRNVTMKVCISSLSMIRKNVYWGCGGKNPLPLWVTDTRYTVPTEYLDMYIRAIIHFNVSDKTVGIEL